MPGSARKLRVLPDTERVEESLLCAAAREGFVDASGHLTFGQLVELFEGAKHLGRRPCSPLTGRVVLLGVARELGAGPYRAYAQEPAFARSALDLIFDLKAGGLDADGFARAAVSLPEASRERSAFLARLYSAYEQKMSLLQLADREDLQRGASARLREKGLPDRIRSLAAIEIAHVHDFPPARLEFLLSLAEQCERCGISFALEVPAGGFAQVDPAVDPVLSAFERRGERSQNIEVGKEDLLGEGRPFAAMGAFLFSTARASAPGSDLANRLQMFSAGTAREEARQLAHEALSCIRRGVPPDRIAIAYRDLGPEAEWVSEALEEAGVDARVRRGAPLSSTAAGKMALEFPKLVDDGFRSEQVAALLSSRYAPALSMGSVESPESLFALAGVRDDLLGGEGGRGAYQVRLEALAARLDRKSDAGRAAQVRSLLERTLKLIAVGRRIPASGRALELLNRWWTSLSELRFPEAVRQREQRSDEETIFGRAVLRAVARDQAALDALRSMAGELEGALKLAGAGDDRIDRRTFYRLLLDAAADFNLMERAPRGGAVHVLDVRELPGRRFDHVFIAGMLDGRFPKRTMPHPLFNDDDRAAINRLAGRTVFRLTSGDSGDRIGWQLAEDRLLFHLALCSTEGSLALCYAREGRSGEEQIPSPFLDEVARITGIAVRDLPLRPLPLLEEVDSETRLRERIALEVLSRPDLRTSEPDSSRKALIERFEQEPWLAEARELANVEEERLRFFSQPAAIEGRFTGRVDGEDVRATLQELFRFGPDQPASAYQLGRFGNCAFQGFLGYALRLDEPDSPGEEMDSKRQGSFWHQVLENLFTRLGAAGLIKAAPEELPPGLLDEALAEAAVAAEQSGHVGHPLLWKLGRDRARGMVHRLLRADHRGVPFEEHVPRHAELRFGYPDSPEKWREVRIPAFPGQQDVFVHGKIDRLDSAAHGVGVIDYKSGYISSGRQLVEKLLQTDFQLPLYLYAARASGELGRLRAALLSLRTAKSTHLDEAIQQYANQSIDDLLSTDPEVRARLEAEEGKNLANAVRSLVTELRAGHFPIRAHDCAFCSFQQVCRITERRVYEGEG